MIAVASPAKSMQEWLDELVAAATVARFSVSMAGMSDAGIALAKVHCKRHDQRLNWTSAYRHLEHSEASYRLQHGAGSKLHQVGDLRPVSSEELGGPPPTAWTPAKCRRCDGWVIWARLEAGTRIPVDATAEPAGSVVLVAGLDHDEPLAMMLFTEQARAQVGDRDVHRPHRETCGRNRRPKGRRR